MIVEGESSDSWKSCAMWMGAIGLVALRNTLLSLAVCQEVNDMAGVAGTLQYAGDFRERHSEPSCL